MAVPNEAETHNEIFPFTNIKQIDVKDHKKGRMTSLLIGGALDVLTT